MWRGVRILSLFWMRFESKIINLFWCSRKIFHRRGLDGESCEIARKSAPKIFVFGAELFVFGAELFVFGAELCLWHLREWIVCGGFGAIHGAHLDGCHFSVLTLRESGVKCRGVFNGNAR